FQPAIELELDAALLAHQVAFREEEVVESLKRLLALAARLKAEAQLSGDAGDGVLAGIRSDNANGDDQVAPAFEQRAPVTIEVGDKLRSGEHRVVAKPARHGARMTGSADAFNHAVTDVAAHPGHDGDGQPPRREHRTLLDVQLDPCRKAFRVGRRLSLFHSLDVDPDLIHARAEGEV